MRTLGNHAVVIGGSVAGLLAARVLSESFQSVTVVERDSLPAGDEGRRAIPQGRHAHALIVGGLRAFEELLPGFGEELIADGALTFSAYSDMDFMVRGHQFPRVSLGETAILASRPFIEGHLRRRVLSLENVSVREHEEALDLTATADRGRVAGVRVRGRAAGSAEQTLTADLVVAATGRSAKVPAWLERLGYERPSEDALEVDLGYASRRYRLPKGALVDKLILRATVGGFPHGVALFAQEEDLWLLTLAGYGEHRPAADEESFTAFLERSVAPPGVLAALRDGEPVDEIVAYRFPGNLRRRYDKMRRFPDGLLVIGDAICSFNPIYGQGMTVAAFEARALRSCLGRGTDDLPSRYFRATKGVVDHAWQAAVSSDLGVPGVEGKRSLPWRMTNAYMDRLMRSATTDGEVTAAFGWVSGMRRHPLSLFRPAIVRRVLGKPSSRPPLWPGRALRTPVRRRTIQIDAVATPLREAGPPDASEAVVFVHGALGSGADFEPLLAAAGQLGRAVAWDAPGLGRSTTPTGFEHTLDGHARFIARALRALEVERAHIVLHGFGGAWGLRWAGDEPERVASVTLIDTGVEPRPRWSKAAEISRVPLAGDLLARTLTRTGFRTVLARASPHPLPGPFVDRMFGDLDLATRHAILRLCRSISRAGERYREPPAALRSVGAPALVIYGEHDPYISPALTRRQQEAFPDPETHVIQGSGHWPFVEQADRVEQLLLGLLAQTMTVVEPEGTANIS